MSEAGVARSSAASVSAAEVKAKRTNRTASAELDAEVTRSDLAPQLDPVPLVVVRLAPDAAPTPVVDGFSAVVRDDQEVTVVCAETALDGGRLGDVVPVATERGWRRVTFPGPLPWQLVGFLADVAGRLAQAQIPFTSMSGFHTDHVLVRAPQADLAVSVLSGRPTPPQRPGTNP